jgi:hypothetical protein
MGEPHHLPLTDVYRLGPGGVTRKGLLLAFNNRRKAGPKNGEPNGGRLRCLFLEDPSCEKAAATRLA